MAFVWVFRMTFGATTARRAVRNLFWIALAAVLLLGSGRLLASPLRQAAASPAPLLITEFAADNGGELLDEDGEPADWIELHNRSAEPVNLAGWSLTDDPTLPTMWTFGDLTLEPDARLLVFASAKDRRRIEVDDDTGVEGFLHTNFRLDADGGFLALYPPTARRHLDGTALHYPPQFPGVSFGRHTADDLDGDGFGYFAAATPGAANPAAADQLGMTAPVEISAPHGLYSAPVSVTLTTSDAAAEIRYTLDGSAPVADSLLYTAPFTVERTTVVRAAAFRPGYRPWPAAAQSYIFAADVAAQPAMPAGSPETWGTHPISMGSAVAGEPVAADYAMDPRITQHSIYGPRLPGALAALPVVSIAAGAAGMDIYATPQDRGRAAERLASVELFFPDGSAEGFQVNAGLRIQGGAGRWEFMPKHSFRLFFRSEYGASRLHYRLFPDSPVEEFDTLILRAGADESFAGHPAVAGDDNLDLRRTTYGRDQWLRASQLALSGMGVHGRYVHLYYNGLYWGIYNLVERPDAGFMAAYFGGADHDYGVLSQSGAVSGPMDRFNVLLQLAQEGGLADPAKYATMLEFVDPEQFADYVILNWYAGNRDWPENNWYAGAQYPAGRNLFFVWDGEMTWFDGAQIALGGSGVEGAPFPNVVKLVFTALMENPEFRLLFADRLHRALAAGGPLSDAAAQQRWRAVTDPLAPAIAAESARWGDARYAEPLMPTNWEAARRDVLAQMEGNAGRLLDQARAAGYFPPIDPPTFGAASPFTDTLDLTLDGPGEIYFTSDGSDPRTPGSGAPAAAAQRYSAPLRLDAAATVKARSLAETDAGPVWSALAAREFRRAGDAAQVRFTEIMYHPLDGDEYEFVEIANLGEAPADLGGAYLTGVDFRFARNIPLVPGQVIVLVSDFERFRERYPTPEIHGVYSGKLSDRGERLALYSADGALLDAVEYRDEDGWPLSADGTGDSLVRRRADARADDPHAWLAAETLHGTPGALSLPATD